MAVYRTEVGGVKLVSFGDLEHSLATGAYCFQSPDADVLWLPTCSLRALCACTSTMRSRRRATIVATQVVVGGLHKAHCAAVLEQPTVSACTETDQAYRWQSDLSAR